MGDARTRVATSAGEGGARVSEQRQGARRQEESGTRKKDTVIRYGRDSISIRGERAEEEEDSPESKRETEVHGVHGVHRHGG